jgi:threonine/homoserine/homoserine lactone efflux protein
VLFALLVGLAIGFVGSVPVAGPIAAVIVRRGLEGRYRSGAFVALGGALPEAGYAYLAFWGFSTFLARYAWIELVSRGAAALILVALGITFLRYTSKASDSERLGSSDALKSFWVGFTITALNPTLIATWTAATTTLYSIRAVALAPRDALAFALGAMVGIVGWFLCLLGIMRKYRSRFSQTTLDRVVRGFGWFLIAVAAWFVWRFVQLWTAP